MTSFVDLDDALLIIERLGFHVRDVGLLASALARPATTVGGRDAYPKLTFKAAALLESLTKNHALPDGNKRTAWTVMAVFLWLNGYKHDFTTDVGFNLVLGVADGSIPLNESEQIIAAHLKPRV
ncbi:type II toxin-antitoxin system death-on-curing family toxin [Sinomonas gamaensis]|uniref:type II toxin-antitoxin system death-on-curing family toxin n=1 Tax=Sinomonas gamaensis TaxID=2565624 RepID=UPI0011089560|nr:Fic family protein [Sinomonas gamaensis]